MTHDDFIPVCAPLLGEEEKRYLAECVDSGWISSEGPFVARLERGMAEIMDRRHGVAVCNGTAALDVALAALEIKPGDEVILPTFTIISCVLQVVRAGATPVFVDCDPDTWLMDTAMVEACVTPRTRAIIAVHIYGLPVDMDPLLRLCEERGLSLVEDAAQAIGLRYKDRPCGSFGHLSTLSFYPNKLVTTGEGGLVLTDDLRLLERCRSLRNLCFAPGERFLHHELGWNYRMSNMQAAVGVAQMERLGASIERKRAIGRHYRRALGEHPLLRMAPDELEYASNLYWAVGVVLDREARAANGRALDAKTAMGLLAERGVGTRPFFRPLHAQPALREFLAPHQPPCPTAEDIAPRGFYLPNGAGLSTAQLDRAINALLEILEAGA